MLKCSTCEKEYRNTVITKCMHCESSYADGQENATDWHHQPSAKAVSRPEYLTGNGNVQLVTYLSPSPKFNLCISSELLYSHYLYLPVTPCSIELSLLSFWIIRATYIVFYWYWHMIFVVVDDIFMFAFLIFWVDSCCSLVHFIVPLIRGIEL